MRGKVFGFQFHNLRISVQVLLQGDWAPLVEPLLRGCPRLKVRRLSSRQSRERQHYGLCLVNVLTARDLPSRIPNPNLGLLSIGRRHRSVEKWTPHLTVVVVAQDVTEREAHLDWLLSGSHCCPPDR